MLPHDALDIPVEFGVAASAQAEPLSPWTRSRARRVFDIAFILAISPLLLPAIGVIALAIAVTSGTPIVFRQTRAGRFGRSFTIFKFRTMTHAPANRASAIAAHAADEITTIGRLLRRSKLDELPQALNVLIGDMSLVGPRPKVPAQQQARLDCRPGLTGSATLAFAHEERLFAQIPRDLLDDYYRDVVLPAKHRLDTDYLKRATLLSDLQILRDTALGRWGFAAADTAADSALIDSPLFHPLFHQERPDHARPAASVSVAATYSSSAIGTRMASETATAGDC